MLQRSNLPLATGRGRGMPHHAHDTGIALLRGGPTGAVVPCSGRREASQGTGFFQSYTSASGLVASSS